ncbi:MAG: 4-vinyl reductase [Opitutaceae bacterium]
MSSFESAHSIRDRTIRLAHEQRVTAVPVASLGNLHTSVRQAVGMAAPDVLYRSGYEWGLQEMVTLSQHLQEAAPGNQFDFWQSEVRPTLTQWWAPLETNGWGSMTFDLSASTRGLTLFEIQESAVASIGGSSDQPVCHLCAGLFAGAVSFLRRLECHAVELQCQASGHESCRFIAGPGAEIDSAEIWRQQGATAAEIVRRLS